MARSLRTEARAARDEGTRKVAVKIALKGGRKSPLSYEAGWSPYCDDPVDLYRFIRPGVWSDVKPYEVRMKVPCRKCAKCLQFRQMKWRERAIKECAQGKRTWMVTLTFAPAHLAGIICEAVSSDLADVERAAYRHVQAYLDRLRKSAKGRKFRYLAVYERGEKTGRSHYHLLLHETGTRPIPKSVLEERWRSFVHARLVGQGEVSRRASYVTKYLTKSLDVPPRASGRYGQTRVPEDKKPAKVSFFGVELTGSCGADAMTPNGIVGAVRSETTEGFGIGPNPCDDPVRDLALAKGEQSDDSCRSDSEERRGATPGAKAGSDRCAGPEGSGDTVPAEGRRASACRPGTSGRPGESDEGDAEADQLV